MRNLLIAASLLALAAPAAAQGPAYSVDDEIARNLPSPGEAEAMGRAVGDVAEVLMDVPIGPIVDAVDPGRRLSRRQRERTLGDVASRDDPHYRDRMRRSVDAISVGMGDMVAQMAVLAPVLRRTVEDVERRMDDAISRVPDRRRDEDRGYEGDDYEPDDRGDEGPRVDE